jgi:hypothetical protein
MASLLAETCSWRYYSRNPLIQIKWDGKPSGYAENPVTGFFFENRLHWQFEGGGGGGKVNQPNF